MSEAYVDTLVRFRDPFFGPIATALSNQLRLLGPSGISKTERSYSQEKCLRMSLTTLNDYRGLGSTR